MIELANKDINNYTEKVVGANKEHYLMVSLEIQTNHIKMNLFKLSPANSNDIICEFNNMKLDEKLRFALKTEYIEDMLEEEIRDSMTTYLKNVFERAVISHKWVKEKEYKNNITSYKGESIPLVKWISTFANEVQHESVLEFAPSIVAKIKSIELPESKVNLDFNEYVLYMGSIEKYRGCLGKIVDTRNNPDSPTLVSFPGKGRFNNGEGKLWCSDENLLVIT